MANLILIFLFAFLGLSLGEFPNCAPGSFCPVDPADFDQLLGIMNTQVFDGSANKIDSIERAESQGIKDGYNHRITGLLITAKFGARCDFQVQQISTHQMKLVWFHCFEVTPELEYDETEQER